MLSSEEVAQLAGPQLPPVAPATLARWCREALLLDVGPLERLGTIGGTLVATRANYPRMQLFCDTAQPCVVVIGAFDGVHAGHQELIHAARQDARARELPAIAVTFDPDPAAVLTPQAPRRDLQTLGQRVAALLATGLDAVYIVPFTSSFAQLAYTTFVSDYLLPALHPKAIHVGSNFCMGAYGAGTPAALATYAEGLGITVTAHQLAQAWGAPVSATRIRAAIAAGDVDLARFLMTRAPAATGRVERGRGEGASFGFPTANVHVAATRALPSSGVFAAAVVVDGAAWPAAVNVGTPASKFFQAEAAGTGRFSAVAAATERFRAEEAAATGRIFASAEKCGEGARAASGAACEQAPVPAAYQLLEATLVGYAGDLYGREVSVVLLHKLRGACDFANVEELKAVVGANLAWVAAHLGQEKVMLA